MRRVDEGVDPLLFKILDQPGDAAEAADPQAPRDVLAGRDPPGQRGDHGTPAAGPLAAEGVMSGAGECGGLGGAAENEELSRRHG